MKCEFCDQDAVGYVSPPMCGKHFDLAVLAEKLQSEHRHVTRQNVKDLLAYGLANNGAFDITEADVDRLMAGSFAAHYHIKESTDG